MQMINRGLLWLETITEDKVVVTEMSDKKVCRVQFIPGELPRLILSKPPTSYKKDYNAMSYNYGHSSQGARQPLIFLPEIGGLTQSDRCFTLEELKKNKGKDVVDVSEETNKPVTEEETNEFLKLMKHSEYCVLEQLKRTPAKISLFSLILNYEPHRKTLQKVLSKAYIPQDINP